MDTFRVYARCRPLNDFEQHQGRKAITILDDATLALSDGLSKQHLFQLDRVYSEQATNADIFQEAVTPLIDNVLTGINSTVFAYGITGAGKSFTMFGKQSRDEGTGGCNQLSGIIPLSFQYLIGLMQADPSIIIRVSYIEIYNEQVFDLFQQQQVNLQLSEDPVQGVMVQDLTELTLNTFEEVEEAIAYGNSKRVIAQTKANEVSSRSHAIVIINLQRTILETNQVYVSKLSLVDLAGSEKQSVHSETRGIRSFEGSNINRSLLTLGNCINILSEKRKGGPGASQQFIPYRDSKLTRLLKDSLGGNTKTAMIACVSQSQLCYEETANTLKYACRANKIEKVVHQNIKDSKSLEQYKREAIALRKQNEMLRMNLNSSLVMPGVSSGLSDQQFRLRQKKVADLLASLTRVVEERVLSALQNHESAVTELEREQNRLKDEILNQIGFQQVNQLLQLRKKSSEGLDVAPLSLISNKISKQNPYEEGKKKRSESTNSYARQNILKKASSIEAGEKPTTSYSKYKMSLKELKNIKPNEQQLNQPSSNLKSNKNYPLINLEDLRRKVMEDKKQLTTFKQQIKQGLLTQPEIQTKAMRLLQLQQSSILRFNTQERQYLLRLTQGQVPDQPSRYSSAKRRIQNLGLPPTQTQCSDFTLKIVEQKGISHSRHMHRLNRIVQMAQNRTQLPGDIDFKARANYSSVGVERGWEGRELMEGESCGDGDEEVF